MNNIQEYESAIYPNIFNNDSFIWLQSFQKNQLDAFLRANVNRFLKGPVAEFDNAYIEEITKNVKAVLNYAKDNFIAILHEDTFLKNAILNSVDKPLQSDLKNQITAYDESTFLNKVKSSTDIGDLMQSVSSFITNQGNVNITDENNESLLMQAAKKGIPGLAFMLIRGGADIEHTDNQGRNFLHYFPTEKREAFLETAKKVMPQLTQLEELYKKEVHEPKTEALNIKSSNNPFGFFKPLPASEKSFFNPAPDPAKEDSNIIPTINTPKAHP